MVTIRLYNIIGKLESCNMITSVGVLYACYDADHVEVGRGWVHED